MAEFILKDRYGKEQTFNHDTIFVQGTDGELVQFTEGEGDIPAVLQDKTVTENGTYSADEGYDGLGSVIVEVASSTGSISYCKKWVTLTGTHNEKVSVDFGFVPDFLLVYPGSTATNSRDCLFLGISTKWAEKFGVSTFTGYYYPSGTGWGGSGTSTQIDATTCSRGIYGADATGFYIATAHASGGFYVIAIGL